MTQIPNPQNSSTSGIPGSGDGGSSGGLCSSILSECSAPGSVPNNGCEADENCEGVGTDGICICKDKCEAGAL